MQPARQRVQISRNTDSRYSDSRYFFRGETSPGPPTGPACALVVAAAELRVRRLRDTVLRTEGGGDWARGGTDADPTDRGTLGGRHRLRIRSHNSAKAMDRIQRMSTLGVGQIHELPVRTNPKG